MVDEQPQDDKPGFWTVVVSVIAAAFGVQSSRNRERDFRQGSALPFIVGGLIFAVLFVIAVVLAVQLVLPE